MPTEPPRRPQRPGTARGARDAGGRPQRTDGGARPQRADSPRTPRDPAARPQRGDGPRSPRDPAARPQRGDGPRSPRDPAARPQRGDGPRTPRDPAARPQRDGAPGRPAGRGGPRDASRTGPRAATARDAAPPRRERPTGPPLPPDADPRLLPSEVRRELRSLQDATADRVAAHLVAAGQLVDEDPAAAYEHAKAAKALAQRVGAVREAVGVAAYAAGDYAAALTELKAARRISGLPDHLPLIADCERALGRPDRALAVAADPDRLKLDRAAQVELKIVASGARRDMGQPDAAVLALQGPDLDDDGVHEWTVRLWYAYADALLAAGRHEDALMWFTATAAVDEDGETDADERLAELTRPAGE